MATLTVDSSTPDRTYSSLTPVRTITSETPDRTITLLGVFAVLYANIAGSVAGASSVSGAVACFDVVYVAASMSAASSAEGTVSVQDAVYFGWESGDNMAWEDGSTIVVWEII